MLRITRSVQDGTVCLKLEGKLAAEWVEAFRSACAAEMEHGLRPVLDLSDVAFVDREGLQLLRRLETEGVRVQSRSNFVAELMRLERS